MDIFQALKKDHQEMKKLFYKLELPPHVNGESRDSIFAKLKAKLEIHSEAEESVFYTQLRQNPHIADEIEHAVKEHDQVLKAMDDLESMEKNSGTWLNKLMSLHDDVQHHINEEEGNIFQKAQLVIEPDQAQKMGVEFQNAKRRQSLRI